MGQKEIQLLRFAVFLHDIRKIEKFLIKQNPKWERHRSL